jgi:hypothetical protein
MIILRRDAYGNRRITHSLSQIMLGILKTKYLDPYNYQKSVIKITEYDHYIYCYSEQE